MPIRIEEVDGMYIAWASPPESEREWQTPHPMTIEELDRRLFDLGCHITDISDAFYEADPDWVGKTAEAKSDTGEDADV